MDPNGYKRALIILNPASGGGRGLKRWTVVRDQILGSFEARTIEMNTSGNWERAVQQAIDHEISVFIAVGGDGTVRAVTDALVRYSDNHLLESFTLGAVGTGSSNDFHKPIKRTMQGIPLRIGPGRIMRDICRASFHQSDNNKKNLKKYFIVSTSIGLLAEANAFFSGNNRIQRWLRSRWTNLAILHAALRTLFSYKNIEASLILPGRAEQAIDLTNLSVTKSQWVSGSFRYDIPVTGNSGLMGLFLCEGMSRIEILQLMKDTKKGRFLDRPGRSHWKVPSLKVKLKQPATLELDGELFEAEQVTFEVLDKKIGVCL